MGSHASRRNTLILCVLALLASAVAARAIQPDRQKELASLRAEAAALHARQDFARQMADEAAFLLDEGDLEAWQRAMASARYLTPREMQHLADIEERIRQLQTT